MISAEKYRIEREKLMEKWERECREWAAELSGRPVVATFFKDGVVDPDTWFNNDFRPLFVLKEVHDKNPLDITTFDFVDMNEEAGYDIWNATGNWSRLAVLAEGLVSTIIKGKEIPSYDELRDEFFYKKSRTHHDALKNIAV